MIELINGDCLEKMKDIPTDSVDMVLVDPPYGTTSCRWDSIIDLEAMWEQLKRIVKPTGAIVMTASQPFTTTLISSNMDMFKYCWVWDKQSATGFVHSKNKPMKQHEDIVVFSSGTTVHKGQSKIRMTYNPQGLIEINKKRKRTVTSDVSMSARPSHKDEFISTHTNYPQTILQYKRDKGLHPTQKPVALMEYLIVTYTEEGETVMDFTMGSGSTGVAALNTNRSFIGIEMDDYYFQIAKARIDGDEDKIEELKSSL